jgi:predicted enzyme related to lactoylglutathione lyase
MQLIIAIAFVNDMDRSAAFYRDVVGLTLTMQSPGWTEFSTGGATFALHLAEQQQATTAIEYSGTCRPGFKVANLEEFHQRMVSHGVPCIQEPQSIHGSKVAQYCDPDGLVIYISEA